MNSRVMVANAPVSFGAFEVTLGVNPNVPAGADVLDAVARAGYDGIDLGPPGYLGTVGELPGRLRHYGLRLAGGYVALPFSQPDVVSGGLSELDALLDILDAGGGPNEAAPRPRPTLADAGSDARRARPGQAQRDRTLGLDAAGWERLAEGVTMAVEACRRRGYEPAFHHHAGTYIEAPWEIEELLARTDVRLCLDTGHLLLGGGDPLQATRDWGERINHVHLKDARLSIIDGIIRDRAPITEVWRRRAFCPLGEGDLRVDGVLEGLKAHHYQGWLVVEQDTIPGPADPMDRAVRDQARNRTYLRARGF
jgi:inosose dehydratase